jgi:hypothetical protein
MPDQNKEPWQELCELAAKEQDPAKLLKLIQEITQLLEAKLALAYQRSGQPKPKN